MARDEDEQQRLIREDRMRKGKAASTASARREKVDQNLYVPKTRKRKDPMIVGEGSQSQMRVFGYDRMEEERMFYQPQDEAEDEEVEMMMRCQRMLWRIILTQIM